MKDIHDIKPQIEVSIIDWRVLLGLFIFFIIFVGIIILIIVIKYLKKHKRSRPQKPKVNYKTEALQKLYEIKNSIQSEKEVNADEIHFLISSTIRWYIGGMRAQNGLSKTRSDVYIQLTQCFDEILWKCYMVEFAGKTSTKEDMLKTIDLAINKVNECN